MRCGGVEVLADPGTYCYHEHPDWRRYFRSTRAHNTLSIEGRDQSVSSGPFMWSRHAKTRVVKCADLGVLQLWSAEHDGYERLNPPARHRRTVTLDAGTGGLEIVDELEISGIHRIGLVLQLGPTIEVHLVDHRAELEWETPGGRRARGLLELPSDLGWSVHRGQEDPILGWYSPSFGTKVPASVIVGIAETGSIDLHTRLSFNPGD